MTATVLNFATLPKAPSAELMWAPARLVKAKAADKGKPYTEVIGIASTQARDAEGHVIVQDGIDWSDIQKGMKVHYEHPKGYFRTAGHVVETRRIVHKGHAATAVKVRLWTRDPHVARMVQIAKAGMDAGCDNVLGFSIEGGATEFDPMNDGVVLKSKVTSLALTDGPQNPYTWVQKIAASMAAAQVAGALGYPVQGRAYSDPLAPAAPQSLDGAAQQSADVHGSGRTGPERLALRVAKRHPDLTWAEACGIAKRLSDRSRT